MKSTEPILTFKGGSVAGPGGVDRADVLVENGRVAAVGDLDPIGQVIDVTDQILMPGMVDTHVHLMEPGDTSREDFPTGSRAAAARGVTTIIEHTHSDPVKRREDLDAKLEALEGRSNVDFALAAHVWPEDLAEIPHLHDAGVAFFKIFTCDTHGVPGIEDEVLRAALRQIAEVDGRALIHNEDQQLTLEAERRLRSDARFDPAVILEWRHREAELKAVAATASLLVETGTTATFAHVSNTAVLDVIDQFRIRGASVVAEACPQYFAIEESEILTHGPLRKFTPPARIRSDSDRRSMWDAVSGGRFGHFSTDHAPSTLQQKTAGDIWDVPFGLPGLDTTLPFLLDAALSGLITLPDLVRLYSEGPARLYRLPKGRLAPGSDADIVVVDPNAEWVVSNDDILSKAGWSPYEGRRFRGRVTATYLRGALVAAAGTPEDRRLGRFVKPLR